jgi:hypothetical protein
VMYARAGERRVRLWRRRDAAGAVDAGGGAFQRPWMFGYPLPAWFEADDPEPADELDTGELRAVQADESGLRA